MALSERARRIAVSNLPHWSQLSPDVRQAFDGLDAAIERSTWSDQAVIDWTQSLKGEAVERVLRLVELEHRLSDQLLARAHSEVLEPRSPREIDILKRYGKAIRADALGEFAAFSIMLAKLHRACGGAGSVRVTAVRSKPDRLGTYVLYPDVEAIEPGLRRLHDFLRWHFERHPTYAAAVAMTSICNLHPFGDGNGRVSRLLFNGLLRSRDAAFLPLYELGRLSRGGGLIVSRLAQYRDQWAPLAMYLSAAVACTQRLTRGTAG